MRREFGKTRYIGHAISRSAQSFSVLTMFVFSAICQAEVTFYTEEAEFLAATSDTTLTDFEGIVA